MVMVLKRTEKHEYHFCTNFSLLFHTLLVQIRVFDTFKKNTWNKKNAGYSKQSENCAKFEHEVFKDVFEEKNFVEEWKKF
jgi:hypothetical protein